MPTYKLTDPATGKSYRLKSDSTLTQEQMVDLVNKYKAQQQPIQPAQEPTPQEGDTGPAPTDSSRGRAKLQIVK